MRDNSPPNRRPSTRSLNTRPCTGCDAQMKFTGLPDVSGPVYYRIYKCQNCGFVRQDVDSEELEGWG